MRRQHSSDSVSSVASATSHSSVGSNMDADAKHKKKNKKNWVCTFVDMQRHSSAHTHTGTEYGHDPSPTHTNISYSKWNLTTGM